MFRRYLKAASRSSRISTAPSGKGNFEAQMPGLPAGRFVKLTNADLIYDAFFRIRTSTPSSVHDRHPSDYYGVCGVDPSKRLWSWPLHCDVEYWGGRGGACIRSTASNRA